MDETATEKSSGPIAVIGGGPMGLAVAYHLTRAGQQVEVFEAGPVVGGMSASFDFEGLAIERYYHFICTPDQPLFDLLEELGIADKLQWRKTRMGYFYEGKLHRWGDPIALLRFPHLSLIEKVRYGLFALSATRRNNWQQLDRRNAVEWLTAWLGPRAYSRMWQGLFNLKFYHFTDNLSAAWIWTRIRRIGRSRYNLLQEKLGYMEGGSELIMNRLREEIQSRGGRVHLLAKVDEVVTDQDRVTGLRLGQEVRAFDRVISTIPTPYVPAMIPTLPPAILAQLRSINNVAVVCIIVKLARSLTENFWLNVVDQGMDIPGLVEYTRLNDWIQDQHIVYIPYYLPVDHPLYQAEDQEFFDKVQGYLKQINPELRDEDFIAIRASRYRHAQPVCEPGFGDKLPPIRLPLEGLYAADTSYYYPEDRGISESVDLGKTIAAMVVEDGR
jgi:protoporphyrinogen oxidase